MRSFFAAIALAASMVGAAQATTVYQFQVTSMGCSGLFCEDWSDELNSLTISMTAPVGELQVLTTGWPWDPVTSYYVNENIAAVGFDALQIRVNTSEGRCETSWLCLMEASLFGTDYLQGSIRTNSVNHDIFMASSGTEVWSGYLNSDRGPTTPDNRPVYTGVWRAVPEPGVLSLLLAGMVGLMGLRRGEGARVTS